MVTSVSDYHAPILPLEKPYFTGSQGIERVKLMLAEMLVSQHQDLYEYAPCTSNAIKFQVLFLTR